VKINKSICQGIECRLCIKACPTNALYRSYGQLKIYVYTARHALMHTNGSRNQSTIEEFMERYHIGKPEIKVEVKRGFVVGASVIRSAPCGSTWYVAQQIRGREISGIENVVAVAHHSYPCTASMEINPELGDAILHRAGYIIRDAVEKAISESIAEEE